MLKRFRPSSQPDGSKTEFLLPDSYVGGDISLFMNGQLLDVYQDTDHPYGYDLDEDNKKIIFYVAPLEEDYIYVIYDDSGESSNQLVSGSGVLRLTKGYTLISYPGAIKAMWDKENHKVIYPDDVLANVKNLIIDQIEDVYGCPASDILREIQTYRDDSGKYRTFIPGSTAVAWTNNGEHIVNDDLYRDADDNDFGDPDNDNKVYYNPNCFLLANCILDTDDTTVISNDEQNPIDDLPMGNRSGIHLYIYPDADLSATDDLLEIYF